MIDPSSKESPETALEERKRILSIMRKKGLKLSEDGLRVPLKKLKTTPIELFYRTKRMKAALVH